MEFPLRALAILLILACVGSLVPSGGATAPAYESTGSYTVGTPSTYFTTSCDLSGQANNVGSSCRSLGGTHVDGLVAKVRDEGPLAPVTQQIRVCFYSALNYMLDCAPSSEGCAGPSNPAAPCTPAPGCEDNTWAWCGHVPPGTRIYGVTSATGANVHWHLVIG